MKSNNNNDCFGVWMGFLKHLQGTQFSKSAKDSLYENKTYFGNLFPASETGALRIAT